MLEFFEKKPLRFARFKMKMALCVNKSRIVCLKVLKRTHQIWSILDTVAVWQSFEWIDMF